MTEAEGGLMMFIVVAFTVTAIICMVFLWLSD